MCSPKRLPRSLCFLWTIVAMTIVERTVVAQDPVETDSKAKVEATWRRLLRYQSLDDAYRLTTRRFSIDEYAGSDGTLLELVLTRFHVYNEYKELGDELVIETFEGLARRNWHEDFKRGTPKDIVDRLRKQHADEKANHCELAVELSKLRQKYEELTEATQKPWPFDWTRNERHWTAVSEALFESLHADDPSEPWRKLIEIDAEKSRLYMAAYLGVLRGRKSVEVDMHLISAYVSAAANDAERLRRLGEALASVAAAEPDATVESRTKLREDFMAALRSSSDSLSIGYVNTLADIVTYGDSETETKALLKILANRDSPVAFDRLCKVSKIPAALQWKLYLCKPVEIKGEDLSLSNALTMLQRKAYVAVWVDDVVDPEKLTVTLDASGPWLDVMQAVADATRLQLIPLDERLLWLGPHDRRLLAERVLRQSLGKIPAQESATGAALCEPSNMEFADTPFSEVCDYLQDLHDVHIHRSRRFVANSPLVTHESYHHLPLHLQLTLLTSRYRLEWDVAEETIAIGSIKYIASFRDMFVEHRRRELRLLLEDNAVNQALVDSTTVEFIETPLDDVTDYLSDYHGVPIICVDRARKECEITQNLKRFDLAWTLSLMTHEHELDWHADADAVFVGERKAVATHRARSSDRVTRRAKYPMGVAEALRKRLILSRHGDLDVLVADLATSTGVAVEVDKTLTSEKIGVVMLKEHKLPMDVWLDLIAIELGIDWRVEARKKIVFCRRADQ